MSDHEQAIRRYRWLEHCRGLASFLAPTLGLLGMVLLLPHPRPIPPASTNNPEKQPVVAPKVKSNPELTRSTERPSNPVPTLDPPLDLATPLSETFRIADDLNRQIGDLRDAEKQSSLKRKEAAAASKVAEEERNKLIDKLTKSQQDLEQASKDLGVVRTRERERLSSLVDIFSQPLRDRDQFTTRLRTWLIGGIENRSQLDTVTTGYDNLFPTNIEPPRRDWLVVVSHAKDGLDARLFKPVLKQLRQTLPKNQRLGIAKLTDSRIDDIAGIGLQIDESTWDIKFNLGEPPASASDRWQEAGPELKRRESPQFRVIAILDDHHAAPVTGKHAGWGQFQFDVCIITDPSRIDEEKKWSDWALLCQRNNARLVVCPKKEARSNPTALYQTLQQLIKQPPPMAENN